MELAQLSQKIREDIARGSRALQRLEPATLKLLNIDLRSSDPSLISQAILIATHSSHSETTLAKALTELLQRELPVKDTILLLNATRLHVVEGSFKAGERLQQDFLEALRSKLYHPRAEVREWTLRLVDQCGTQSIVFRGDLDKIKPKLWQLLRAEWRVVLELITFIQRKWQPHERSPAKNP